MDEFIIVLFIFLVSIPAAIIAIIIKVNIIRERQRAADKTNDLLEKMSKEHTDIPSQIQKLAELNRAGMLTDTEFQTKKAELLKKL